MTRNSRSKHMKQMTPRNNLQFTLINKVFDMIVGLIFQLITN